MNDEPIDEASEAKLHRALRTMPSLQTVPDHAREALLDETVEHVKLFMGGPRGSSPSGVSPLVTTKSVTCPRCANVFSITCP